MRTFFKKKMITLSLMFFLGSQALTITNEIKASDNVNVIFSLIKKIVGGSVSFVKFYDGHTYIGTLNGKLYQQDKTTKDNNAISPVGINDFHDLFHYNNTYFISTGQGLYTSQDMKAWAPSKSQNLMNQNVYMVIAHNNAMYAAAEQGIYKSEDNGNSWTLLDNTKEKDKRSSRFIVSNGTELLIGNTGYAEGYSFMKYSDDNGKTWKTTGQQQQDGNNYLIDNYVNTPITVVNNTFYAGSYVYPVNPSEDSYSALISSQDGKTWKIEQKHKRMIELSHLAHDGYGRIYMATDQRLFEEQDDMSPFFGSFIYGGHPGQDDWKLIEELGEEPALITVLDDQVLIATPYGQILAYNPEDSKKPELDSTVTSAYVNSMAVGDDNLYASVSGALKGPSGHSNDNCVSYGSLQNFVCRWDSANQSTQVSRSRC